MFYRLLIVTIALFAFCGSTAIGQDNQDQEQDKTEKKNDVAEKTSPIEADEKEKPADQLSTEDEAKSDPAIKQSINVRSALLKIIETVEVPAEQSGVLTKLIVKEGEYLKKGQAIAKIRDDEVKLRLDRAKLELDVAKLSAENDVDIRFYEKSTQVAQAEVDRADRSNNRIRNSVPRAEVESLQLARDKAILQHEQAERDFKIAHLKVGVFNNDIALTSELLSRYRIYAPIDGLVVGIETRAGEWVDPGNPVVRLVRLDRLRVEGFVTAEEASQLPPNAKINITFTQPWLREKSVEGKIVFINPEANPVNNSVQVWAEVANEDLSLKPGLRVNMEILPESADDADDEKELDESDLSVNARAR